MKRVRILVPFDGYMPGDEAEFTGRTARQYIAEKKAEALDAPLVEVNLDDMTAAQLKAYAEENGIDLGDATKKDDIRAAIQLALESRK